jgi:hypothetical protein
MCTEIDMSRFEIMFQYEGVPRPYGNCGTQPLKYYNASESYTALFIYLKVIKGS